MEFDEDASRWKASLRSPFHKPDHELQPSSAGLKYSEEASQLISKMSDKFEPSALRVIPSDIIELIIAVSKTSSERTELPPPPLFLDPPYIAIPLRSFEHCLGSSFLQYLARDEFVSTPSFNTEGDACSQKAVPFLRGSLPSNHRFWFSVWHLAEWPEFVELPSDYSGVNELQEVALAEIEFMREFFGELFTPFDDGSEMNQSINMSALNNYAVVVHGFQGQDGSGGRSIIAAMFYDCSDNGVWVNWIGVVNGLYSPASFGMNSNGSEFRRLGFGRLMLGFAQIHNACKGFSTSLFLQVNPVEDAHKFYHSIGFRPLPEAELQSWAPLIYERAIGSERKTDFRFVDFHSMADQKLEATKKGSNPNDPSVCAKFLRLMSCRKFVWRIGKVVSLSTAIADCNRIYISYPFNVISSVLNSCLGDLIIMGHPCLRHTEENVFVSKTVAKRRLTTNGSPRRRIPRADIYHSTMARLLADDKMWMNDELIHFVATWMFRDASSNRTRDMEFVNPYVSQAVCDICRSNAGPPGDEPRQAGFANIVHQYLTASSDLIWKRFVFFTVNENNKHWWGIVAVNPWKAVIQSHVLPDTFDEREQYDLFLSSMCGSIIVDGLEPAQVKIRQKYKEYTDDDDHDSSDDDRYHRRKQHYINLKLDEEYIDSDTEIEEEVRSHTDTHPLIWLLNMASLYRDLSALKTLDKLHPTRMSSREYWMLGVRGPFGIVSAGWNRAADFPCYFPVITVPRYMLPRQVDEYNCGLVWMSFVFDFIITQQSAFWVVTEHVDAFREYVEQMYVWPPKEKLTCARYHPFPKRRRTGWYNRSLRLGSLISCPEWAEVHERMNTEDDKPSKREMTALSSKINSFLYFFRDSGWKSRHASSGFGT